MTRLAVFCLTWLCSAAAWAIVPPGQGGPVTQIVTPASPVVVWPVAPAVLPAAPVVPVTPAILPSAIAVQPYAAVPTLRWGILHRRLVPGVTFVPTSPQFYVPWIPQQQGCPNAGGCQQPSAPSQPPKP
jgi:hypothetical protein